MSGAAIVSTKVRWERCRRHRRRILEISRQVTAAHVAPAFSCLEIVDALYHEVMRPQDIFIMSKGHGCLAQYVVLEDLGVLAPEVLSNYCKIGDPIFPALGAHPDYNTALGIHASTGSLGHGLGIAAGQALAEKLKSTFKGADSRVYVLLSDGECQEGSTWEAAMVAANLRLRNLVALVDANDFGGLERMSAAFPALDGGGRPATIDAFLRAKFEAFGWRTAEVDGHDSARVAHRMLWPPLVPRQLPYVVICRTVKGKGVSFMENDSLWHYRSPSAEEYKKALEELS